MHRSRVSLALAALLSLCASAAAQDGGIEIFAGETLFAHGTRLSLAHIYRSRTDLYAGSSKTPDPLEREARDHRLVLGYNYGWTPRVTVGALVPLVSKENDLLVGGSEATTSARGLGDVALFGKYRLYTKDAYRTSFNVSTILGIETPTGATSETEGGVTLPTPQQPGSGSWDPFLAVAATSSHGRWRFDGLLLYKLNTEGSRNYKDSDLFAAGLSAAYRYWHQPYPGPSHSARIGLIWREEGTARLGGTALPNSGASQLLLRPALGFHPIPAIDLSVSVDLPLYQHYDGQQLGLDFRTFIAFGYRF